MSRRILVWGLGRVGSVSAACLAERGHKVFALDVDASRVDAFRAGGFADEPGLSRRIRSGLGSGRIETLVPGRDLIPRADFSWICVGTPESRSGGPDLVPIERAVREIGSLAAEFRRPHTVMLRSTVPLGMTRKKLWPLLKRSARGARERYGIVVCPEFLREGSAVKDFVSASYHVVGGWDSKIAAAAASLLRSLGGRVFLLKAEEAELLKLASNAFHAAKATFANEVSRLAEPFGVDAEAVLSVLRYDRRLNASGAYLEAGLPFGGSCLPRDVRTLRRLASEAGVELPLLEALIPSNQIHLESIRRKVVDLGIRTVGVLGLGFKAGVSDLRESPAVALARSLRRDGLSVLVHDRRVGPSDPALRALGLRRSWCGSVAELLARSEAVILTERDTRRGGERIHPPIPWFLIRTGSRSSRLRPGLGRK